VVGGYKKIETEFAEAFLTSDDAAQEKADAGVMMKRSVK
jgi:hypothetical protein